MARKRSVETAELRRSEALVKAAELFVKKGYHGTSVEDIAKELGITKGSVYYYIPSKEQILFQMHDYALQLLLDALCGIAQTTEPADLKLHRAIVTYITICCSESAVVAATQQVEYALKGRSRARILEKADEVMEIVRKLLREGIKSGVFIDCDVKASAFLISGACNWIPRWYKLGGRLTVDEVAKVFADLLLRTFLVRPSGSDHSEREEPPIPETTEFFRLEHIEK